MMATTLILNQLKKKNPIKPQNKFIKKIRKLFKETKEVTPTLEQIKYNEKINKTDKDELIFLNKLHNASTEQLLNFHWNYNFKIWSGAMDKIGKLLKLDNNKILFETGFGTGALMHYFKQKYPDLTLCGNDFCDKYVSLAKISNTIGDGAFICYNSKDIDFIPDNTFDAVLANGSIGYDTKENSFLAMKQCVRICKVGGRIFIGTLDSKEITYKSAYLTQFTQDEIRKFANTLDVKIVALGTDSEISGMQGHGADVKTAICLEKITKI